MTHQLNHSAVPDTLKNFDFLPDSANVRQPVVQALFGCSAATVWRMVKKGTLPAPRKLSERVTAWNVGALRKVLAAEDDFSIVIKKTTSVGVVENSRTHSSPITVGQSIFRQGAERSQRTA